MNDEQDTVEFFPGFRVKKASKVLAQSADGRFAVIPATVFLGQGDRLPPPTMDDRYFDTLDEAISYLRGPQDSN